MKRNTCLITFDIDRTLIPLNGDSDVHCAKMRELWHVFKRAKDVSLHIVSARNEYTRETTLAELKAFGIDCPSSKLHLKPSGGIQDEQHKADVARRLRPLVMFDDSVNCEPYLLKEGFTYLRIPR